MAAQPTQTTTLVSTTKGLVDFLMTLSAPSIFVDLEGESLSRNGTLSIIITFNPLRKQAWLIDVQTLQHKAFSTATPAGKTLKSVLEGTQVRKHFWDVRNDADALWALYGVGLGRVVDVQLFENASRRGDKTYLCGLNNAVRNDAGLGFQRRERWLRVKSEVTAQMAGKIFSKRPLDEKTVQYCVNDVVHLPKLNDVYTGRITRNWQSKALAES